MAQLILEIAVLQPRIGVIRMDRWDVVYKTAFAAAGAAAVWLFGGWDAVMTILVSVVALDYVSGVLRAAIEGRLSSAVGAKGIARKVGFFLLVVAAAVADRAIGAEEPVIRTATALFLVANELLSIVENLAAAGVPIPNVLKNAIELLREKSDRGTGEDGRI